MSRTGVKDRNGDDFHSLDCRYESLSALELQPNNNELDAE